MKTRTLLAALLFGSSNLLMAQTTITIDGEQFVTKNDTTFTVGGKTVTVQPNDSKEKIKKAKDITMAGFYFGFNSALGAPAGMDVKTFKSWELGFDIPLWNKTLSKHFKFHANLGFNWKNFRMTRNNAWFGRDYVNRLVTFDDPATTATFTPGTGKVDYSRMKIFSLTLPLMFEYRFSKKYFAALGPVVNFNLHGSIRTEYMNDYGENVTFKSNGLHQSPVTVDVKCLVGNESLAAYVKWSPCRQLKESFAPGLDFSGISFGAQLVF